MAREKNLSTGSAVTGVYSRKAPHYDALEELWKLKELPLEVRRFICGGVHGASLRQGDDGAIPDDIMKMVNSQEVPVLHPEDEMRMINAVDQYAFGPPRRLRPQYAQIVLKRTLQKLDNEYQHLAIELQRKIRELAQSN